MEVDLIEIKSKIMVTKGYEGPQGKWDEVELVIRYEQYNYIAGLISSIPYSIVG